MVHTEIKCAWYYSVKILNLPGICIRTCKSTFSCYSHNQEMCLIYSIVSPSFPRVTLKRRILRKTVIKKEGTEETSITVMPVEVSCDGKVPARIDRLVSLFKKTTENFEMGKRSVFEITEGISLTPNSMPKTVVLWVLLENKQLQSWKLTSLTIATLPLTTNSFLQQRFFSLNIFWSNTFLLGNVFESFAIYQVFRKHQRYCEGTLCQASLLQPALTFSQAPDTCHHQVCFQL